MKIMFMIWYAAHNVFRAY